MNVIGIIPARYASTRFPGKPLALINGKTMIQRVYEQAMKSGVLSYVVVATDDERIETHVKSFNGNVVMTSTNHKNGTERCLEAVQFIKDKKWDVIINIQGDEPYINPAQIDKVASCFTDNKIQIATLIKKLNSSEELFNPGIIKVTADKNKQAICFSRSPIPYLRDKEQTEWLKFHTYYKHIGIYAYRTDVLKAITRLEPSALERAESLEQLRWIENGYTIHVEYTDHESCSVDTPDDLLKLSNCY